MPEIKQNFSAGKMNKDLDERLLTKGEYRHAENIQVSTSESSDVGAIENILSNTDLSNLTASGVSFIPEEATCVGVYSDEKDNIVYWLVTSRNKDMILRYKNSEITLVLVDMYRNTPSAVLKFNNENLAQPNIITAINLIDNLLFWTDGENEPKKINIDLCIEGTTDENTHTFLIVPEREINIDSRIDIREEHVTIIKKSPKTKIQLNAQVDIIAKATLENYLMLTDLPQNAFEAREVGDEFILDNSAIVNGLVVGNYFNHFENFIGQETFYAGDELLLRRNNPLMTTASELPDIYDVKLKIISDLTGTQRGFSPLNTYPENSFKVKIIEISSEFKGDPNDPNMSSSYYTVYWFVHKEENKIDFFEKGFPRFSYRYKYQDGEYSTFAPFSDIAFFPGSFDYETKKAYNIAMENKLKSLKLEGFIEQDILEDVVQVDLLYKESSSPNVYVVEKLKYKDFKGISPDSNAPLAGPRNNWEVNYYNVGSDTIYATLPSNQLIRPFDNVPRKAKAQEITGNRLVYANYTQNYNLQVSPVVDASYSVRLGSSTQKIIPQKSLKSSRNYQIGIVYLDDYGRQTPVFSSSRSSFHVPLLEAEKSNAIDFSAITPSPEWATSYKIYVKETSNEYYNLAMDRVYRAKDGNLWLSFPSSERNKIDEETFLVLKKRLDDNNPVKESLNYKVIAIENEAPVEVKRNNVFISESASDPNVIFDIDATTPQIGKDSFTVNEAAIKADGAPSIDNITETLLIVFRDNTENIVSDYYEVANINFQTPNYVIKLTEKIKETDAWIYKNYATTTTYNSSDLNENLRIRIYKDVKKEQPEFDGKFFVKILNDESTKKYVLKGVDNIKSYRALSYFDTFYISDTGADYSDSLIDLAGLGNAGTTNRWNSDDAANWKSGILKFNDPNGNTTSAWFIDQVYYAGKHPEDNELESSVERYDIDENGNATLPNGIGIIPEPGGTTAVVKKFVASNALEIDRNYEYSVSKEEYRNGYGKGIYKETDVNGNEQWYMELSFSQILPNPVEKFQNHAIKNIGTSKYINNLNIPVLQKDENFAVGSLVNPEHQDQIAVTRNLEKNKIFKFVGDVLGAKYIINGVVEKEKRYNYKNFDTLLNSTELFQFYRREPSSTWSGSYINPQNFFGHPKYIQVEAEFDLFTSPANRRVTYKIPFALHTDTPSLDSSGNPEYATADLLNNSSFVESGGTAYTNFLHKDYGADENTPHGVQFLEVDQNEGDQLTSDNPAIWETVPKKNIDLNVYYEASEVFPISLHGTSQQLDWFNCYSFGNGVESNRLRDDFNQVTIDKGAVASSTIDFVYEEENRKSGLIYSGLYNSTSGLNNLNQFIGAEKITKDLNPTYGSIQKLFSRNTDLIAFCEDKVVKILANKDAIFNADGKPNLIATQNVLGQTMPFSGDFGISKNPESFSKESYRAYFTDKNRGVVLRLSMDGLTPISDHGMSDFFKDRLKNESQLIGSYDQKKRYYNLTMPNYKKTVSFDEKVRGWSSFKSFVLEQGVSSTNFYYTFKNGSLYKHHDDYAGGGNVTWNNFYGQQYNSKVTTILNDAVDVVKSFKTINYEGSQSNVTTNLSALDSNYHNLSQKQGWELKKITTDQQTGYIPEFLEKEGKWFNNIKGSSINTKEDIDVNNFSFQGVGKPSIVEYFDIPPAVGVFVEIFMNPTIDRWFTLNNSQQQLRKRTTFNDANIESNTINPNLVFEQIFGGNLYRQGESVDEVLQFKIRPGIDISTGANTPVPIQASDFTARHLIPPGSDGERSRAFDVNGVFVQNIGFNDEAGGAVQDLGAQESTLRNEANPNTNAPGTGFLGSTFSPISAAVSFVDTDVPNTNNNHVLLNVPVKFTIPENEQVVTIKVELFLEYQSLNI